MPLQTRHRKLRLNLSPSADNSDIKNDSQEKMNKKLSIKLSLKKASSQEQAQENEDDNREESVKDKSDPDYSDQPKTKRRKATRTPKIKKTLVVKFKYKSETSPNINTSNENRSAPENDTPADGIPTPNPSQYSKITEAATKDLSEDVTDTIPLSQLSGYNRKESENNQGSRNRDHLNSPQDVSIENNTASVTPGANDSNKNVSTNPNLRKVTEISKVTAEDSTLDFSDDSAEIDALLDAIGNGTQANNPISNVPYGASPNNGVNQISTNNGVNQTPTNQLEYQQFYNVRIPYEHTLNGQVRDGNVANLHSNNPNNSAYNHLGFHNVGQVSNGYVSPFSVSGYTTGDPNSTQLGVTSSNHQTQYNAYNQQFPVPNHFVQQQQQQQQTGEADDDDDLVESAVLISLLDPITSNRIRIPVRSRVCSHLDCFDLISFRELNRLSPFNVVSRNQASYIARPKVLALLDDAKRRPLNPQKYNTRTIDFNYRQKKKWNSENKKFNNALEFFCCPICNLEFSIKTPGDLYIIGEMLEILENLNKNSKVSKIELSLDGKWKYYMEKDANTKDTDVDAVNNLNLVEKDYELIDLESDEEAEADVLKVKKEANLSQSIPESEIEEKTEKEIDDFFESIQAESNSGKGSACDPINLDDEDEEEEEEEEEVVENGDTVENTESEEVHEDQQIDKGGVSSEPEQDGTNGNKDLGAKTGLFSNAAKDLAGLGNGGSGLRADILQSANLLGRLIDEDYDEEEDEDYIYNPNNDNHDDDDDDDDEDENGENYENGENGENDAIENELSDLDVDDIVNLEKQVSANSQSQPSQPTQPSQQSQQQHSQQDNKQLPPQSDSVKKSSANNYNLTEEQLKIMERGRSIIGNGMQRIHQIAQETQRQQYIQQSQAQQRNQQYHQHHHQQHPQQQQYQQGPGYGNNSYNNMIAKVTQMVGSNGSTSSQRSNGYSVLPHVFNSYNNPGYHSRPYNFVVGNSNSNNSNNNSNTNPNSSNFGPVFFSGSGDADDPLVLDDDEDE